MGKDVINPCANHNEPHCMTCTKKTGNFFSVLPQDALNLIDQGKITKRVKKGETLFLSGNDPNGVYCINAGTVKLETEGPQGTGHILRVVQSGGMLGYRSLFADEPYQATAIAIEDATICHIPKSTFLNVVQKFPELSLKLLTHVSKELGSAENRMIKMTDQSATERIAESLLFLKENFEHQPWTRKEIAEWAGTTPETVMRTLAQFESQGFIKQSGRKIEITNRNSLIELANLVF